MKTLASLRRRFNKPQPAASPGVTYPARQLSVFVAVPSLSGRVSTRWVSSMQSLQPPLNTQLLQQGFAPHQDLADARNALAFVALRQGFSHLLFLDDDVLPPIDSLSRLHSHNRPLVSALVYARRAVSTPVAWPAKGAGVIQEWNPGDLINVLAHGMALTLIDTRLLEHMRVALQLPEKAGVPKWFAYEAPGVNWGEDAVFCERAVSLGYQPCVDTGVFAWHEHEDGRRCYPLDLWEEWERTKVITWRNTPNGEPVVWETPRMPRPNSIEEAIRSHIYAPRRG
jgi:hypothetical protein